MKEQLLTRIRQCQNLPSLPSIAVQVLELVQDPDADIPKLAALVSKDPALSSKILKTINSSIYARSQPISKLTQALTLLGLQTVRVLVLGFTLTRNVKGPRSKGFKPLEYWRRSIYSATAALTLAQRIHFDHQEEAFIASLLMDIGMPVLDELFGEQYGKLHDKARSHAELARLEESAFETTHAEVSGALAEIWSIPPVLAIPMAFHHRPADVEDDTLRGLTEICYVASRCADVFVDEVAAGAIAEIRTFCQAHYWMTEADCDQFLDQICRRTGEVAPLFDVTLNNGVSYDEILKKASDQLIQVTLAGHQQAQQEKSRLEQQAVTDGLTGLANRGRFDQFLGEQFAGALSAQRPLALVMLDVDHFKKVNDKHGHPAGDVVLQRIAKLAKAAARSQDLAARYGGEEFALVLPNMSRADALAVGEALRREVASRPVEVDGKTIAVTASVGVAALEPGTPLKEPHHLVKAADLALYAAKKSGRNCVRAFALNKPLSGQTAAA